MNAYGYYLDLIEEESPAPVATAPQPEQIPSEYPESDAARAWFNALKLAPPADKDESTSETARFYSHDVTVYCSGYERRPGYGLYTLSPQQRSAGQRSLGTGWISGCSTIEDLRHSFERFLAEREAVKAKADARRDAKRAARSKFKNPYKVGEFLYTSWGYDQTNVDFFQILEVRDTSIKIRAVAAEGVESWRDGGSIIPIANAWRRDSEETNVTIHVYADGTHRAKYDDQNLYTFTGNPVSWSEGH